MAVDQIPEGPPIITEAIWDRWVKYPHPIAVKVQHKGLHTTKESVVGRQLQQLERSTTVQDFLVAYVAALKKWNGMSIFKNISYSLEPAADNKGFVANIEFVEKNEKSAGVSIQREASCTTPEVRFSDNNLFGRAWEGTLMAQGPMESHRQVSFSLRNKNPAFGKWQEWSLFNRSRTSDFHSLKRHNAKGVSFGTDLDLAEQLGDHYFELGYEIRDAQPDKDERVSDALACDRGESDKAYLRHDCTLSRLSQGPDERFPKGLHLWVSNEVCSSGEREREGGGGRAKPSASSELTDTIAKTSETETGPDRRIDREDTHTHTHTHTHTNTHTQPTNQTTNQPQSQSD